MDIFHEHVVADFVSQAQWNRWLLNQVLGPELVRQVVKVPPPSARSSDRMVWALTQDGSFSVSSAYSLVSQASNYLGYRVRLSVIVVLNRQRRRLITFFTRDLNKAVWSRFEVGLGDWTMVSMLRHMVLRWWLRKGHNVYLKFVYHMLPMLVCWELWKVRNKGIFYGRKVGWTEVADQVFQQLCDLLHCSFPEIACCFVSWDVLHASLVGLKRRVSILPISWSVPRTGFKLNSDGCARGNPSVSGGGGVVRDWEGRFIVGYSCFFGSLTSLHAELKAMLFGVRLCVARGFQELHVESDSFVLVQILQGTHGCPWRLQRVVDELLSVKPHFHEITHCCKEANKSADYLANLGANTEQDGVFDDFRALPVTVRGEITMDRLGFPNFRRKLL
ncbi:uncharacterized protein [Coffea arabica]|uniref:RNase H type-1 domain-containing protein n=1 Tax=Coffea arabica TaxID=13443 RepID=A0A6P6WSK2_COFAR|nr:uncharacterized protein LOC113735610 [Coffea arabica]